MKLNKHGLPRRNDINLHSQAEKAIRQAIFEVEAAGADPRLTDAVVLLGQAKEKVADFVEEFGLHPTE